MSTFTITPITKPKTTDHDDELLQAVLRHRERVAKIEFLQHEDKSDMELIRSRAQLAKDGTIVTEHYKIMLIPITSERFDLKKAEEVLGRRILKPFLKNSSYTQLRIK